jgi:hypothetical protein
MLDPSDPYADATPGRPGKRGPATVALPPSGNFKPEMKKRLAEAVDLERRAKIEFDQTGPDNPQRKAHRKAAYDLLKQARDIFNDAYEEDSHSKELDRHIHDVMEMMSALHKEMAVGD